MSASAAVWGVVRRAVGLVLLTLPMLSGYLHMRERALRGADALGVALRSLSAPAPLDMQAAPLPPLPDAGAVDVEALRLALPQGPVPPAGVPQRSAPKSLRAVVVSDQQVLGLVEAGAVPQGVRVKAANGRPGGLQLSGVSALGIGVEDGDILFEVAGVPVKSEGHVAEIVRVLRERRAPSVGARLWRRGETIALWVGMPYLSPGNVRR